MTMRSAPAASSSLGLASPEVILSATPNPVISRTRVTYRVTSPGIVQVLVSDAQGRVTKVLVNAKQEAGTYNLDWDAAGVTKGFYFISILKDGEVKQTLRVVKG